MTRASARMLVLSWPPVRPTARSRPSLWAPFVDRQGEGVGDADQGDEDGQGEQTVDEVEQLVDLGGLLRLVLGLVEKLGGRVGGRHGLDVLAAQGGGGAPGQPDVDLAVQLLGEVGLGRGLSFRRATQASVQLRSRPESRASSSAGRVLRPVVVRRYVD